MVEESKKEEAQEQKKEETERPLDKMTVKELREMARQIPGASGVSSMKKEELLELIKKAEEKGKEENGAAEKGEEETRAEEVTAAKQEEEQAREADKEVTEKGEEAKAEEEKGEEETRAEEKEKPLERMTATELREIAREIPGVTGVSAMKKEQLLALIEKSRGIKEEAPVKISEERTAEKDAKIRELKQKIILLKKEKEAARTANDRKKVDVFRRRINRLKKRTRKVAQAA